jgi:UDP-N-acetylglucosamine 2-epimerase (non-hydrolysing)
MRECLQAKGIEFRLLHTGQHFDDVMSKVFFEDLELDKPDIFLEAGGKSEFEVIGDIMLKCEKAFKEERPDWVIVPGDVNSTMACAIVANRLGIRLAHLESGLRSFDREMPEEINRIIVDSIADLLLVTEESGLKNLKKEGIPESKVAFVGNTMIDSLVKFLPKIDSSPILKDLDLQAKEYILCTFHRPSNVDSKSSLLVLLDTLAELTKRKKVVFPLHPRTRKNLEKYNLDLSTISNLQSCQPLGYVDFLHCIKNAEIVITDSGGIQEETTFLRVPCLTARDNTERPSTIDYGGNQLVKLDSVEISRALEASLDNQGKQESKIPPLWDGYATERVIEALLQH